MNDTVDSAKPRRVLVCGGRQYDRELALSLVMDDLYLPRGSVIIQGGARGADKLAREWAATNGCEVLTFAAEWQRYGAAAGPLRNQRMIDEGRPDYVVAFPGNRGTDDMMRRARAAGLRVILADRSSNPSA